MSWQRRSFEEKHANHDVAEIYIIADRRLRTVRRVDERCVLPKWKTPWRGSEPLLKSGTLVADSDTAEAAEERRIEADRLNVIRVIEEVPNPDLAKAEGLVRMCRSSDM